MKLSLLSAMFSLLCVAPCAAQTFTVPAEFWMAARSGQAVRAEPQLQQAFLAYSQSDRVRMYIHHQKRDESIAQAEELRGWLIALGIEADRIEMTDDSSAELIKLEIVDIR
jgi:hypothetical protein